MFRKKTDVLFKVKDLTKGVSLDLENDLAILNAFSLKYSTKFVQNCIPMNGPFAISKPQQGNF